MNVNANTLQLLRELETVDGKPNLHAYLDITGRVWTNGYGNTHNVDPSVTITPEQAEQDLLSNAEAAAAVVDKHVIVSLNENQRGALICFIFNEGAGAFIGSHLLTVLNEGDYSAVPVQLNRWIYYHDEHNVARPSVGLQARRAAEIHLWLTPTGATLPPTVASVTPATALTGAALAVPAPLSAMGTPTGAGAALGLTSSGTAFVTSLGIGDWTGAALAAISAVASFYVYFNRHLTLKEKGL